MLRLGLNTRRSNMVDAAGTSANGHAASGQLWTDDGPWSGYTVTNSYSSRLRTGLSLTQPTGRWTNGFSYDAAKRRKRRKGDTPKS